MKAGAQTARGVWLTLGGVCLGMGLGLGLAPAAAGADAPSEFQVKAAFLQKFTSFIEWPHYVFHYDDSPFVIGVLGENPFGDALEAVVEDKDYDGRPFEIHYYERVADVSGCQILYLARGPAGEIRKSLEALSPDGLLTVSDDEEFTRHGGIVRFFVEESRVRFEINVDAAQRAHLKISSKLLILARVVGASAKGGSP